MKSARFYISALLLSLVFTVVISACSEKSDVEIMAAEDAVEAAEMAGADESSPKLLDKARGFLSDAKMLAEQGHHTEAVKKADYAVMRAEQALKNADRLADAHNRDRDE